MALGRLILAIDPGGCPGYVLLDTSVLIARRISNARPELPAIVGAWLKCPGIEADSVAVEGQWLHGPKKKTSVITLAQRAGWQLAVACLTCGAVPHVLGVKEWRESLSCGRVDKRVLQNRVEASLMPAEAAIILATKASPKRRLDLYDAIAIGWGAWLTQPEPWRIPP